MLIVCDISISNRKIHLAHDVFKQKQTPYLQIYKFAFPNCILMEVYSNINEEEQYEAVSYQKDKLELEDLLHPDVLLWLPRVFYKLYCIFVFIVTFIPIYPFFLITLSFRKWHKITFQLKQLHSLILHTLGGIFFIVEQEDELPKDTAYVICSNHSSYIDIILLYRTIPDYFVFMGKKEIEKVPLFGKFFTMDMDISVDRKSNIDAHRAFLKACKEIDEGHSVAIFPEATIPNSAPKMIPFKNGAFKLAIEKQVPIVPVTYTNNWRRLQGSVLLKGKASPGITKAIIHKPISTKGMTEADLGSLKQMTFNVINKSLPQ